MVPCGSSSGEHDYLRLCLVSLRNDPDQQWDNIADITVTSRHKSHNSKFNTAVINDRIITLRNDTINLIFLYTKTLISQVHLFSLSALFACDHNRLSSLHIDVYCCTVVLFHRLETIWHSINMRPPPVLKLGTRKIVSNLLKFISRKPGRRKSACCRK